MGDEPLVKGLPVPSRGRRAEGASQKSPDQTHVLEDSFAPPQQLYCGEAQGLFQSPPPLPEASKPSVSSKRPSKKTSSSSSSSKASSKSRKTGFPSLRVVSGSPSPFRTVFVSASSDSLVEATATAASASASTPTSGLLPSRVDRIALASKVSFPTAASNFGEADCDANISFMSNSTSLSRPDLKAGTLVKLVERLTFDQYSDPNFMKQFLLTYRSFTDPDSLMNLLYDRYAWVPSEGAESYVSNKQHMIRIRVCNVLKYWVHNHFRDFQDSSSLADKLLLFLGEMDLEGGLGKLSQSLAKEFLRKMDDEMSTVSQSRINLATAPKPIIPKSTTISGILAISAQELARQVTIFEHELFKEIRSSELLGQAWSKRKELAPNILRLINWSNRMIKWVTTLVVTETDFKKRASTLKLMIDTAYQCKLLNNYNGVMEILSGLNSSACFRLRKTWGAIGNAYETKFQELDALVHPDRNFAALRQQLESIAPPALPYMGRFLTDLTFIDENSDLTSSGLINFDKRRQIATVIEGMLGYQRDTYNLIKVPAIQEFLKTDKVLNEKDLYNHSLAREKRGGQTRPEVVVSVDSDEEDFGALEEIPGYPFTHDLPGKNVVMEGKTVVSATFCKILEKATQAKITGDGKHFIHIVLTTYRLFKTPFELVRLLRHRFFHPRPLHSTQELLQQFELKQGSKIRLNTTSFLKTWIKNYPYDLQDDPTARNEIYSFLTIVSVADQSLAKICASSLQYLSKIAPAPAPASSSLFKSPPLDPSRGPAERVAVESFCHFSIQDIVEYLYELGIQPLRLVTSRDIFCPVEASLRVCGLIDQLSAEICQWMLFELTKQRAPLEVFEVLCQCICLCLECLNRKNFFAAFPIWQAISKTEPIFGALYPSLPRALQQALQDFSQILDRDWLPFWEKLPGSGLPSLTLAQAKVPSLLAELSDRDLLSIACMRDCERFITSLLEYHKEDLSEPSCNLQLAHYLETVVPVDDAKLPAMLQRLVLPKPEDIPVEVEEIVPAEAAAAQDSSSSSDLPPAATQQNKTRQTPKPRGFGMVNALVRKATAVETKPAKMKHKAIEDLFSRVSHLEELNEKLRNQNRSLSAQQSQLLALLKPLAHEVSFTLPEIRHFVDQKSIRPN